MIGLFGRTRPNVAPVRALSPRAPLPPPAAPRPLLPLPIVPPSPAPRLLLVDDDPKLREVVGYALQREGYAVTEARDGAQALALLQGARFDLLVVDVSMPEVDGFDLIRRLRAEDGDTPVLFLSARSEEIDRILGLELGGDDYVTKPFSTRELVTRVKVLLRRVLRHGEAGSEAEDEAVEAERADLRSGVLHLSPSTHRSWWREHEIVLTATEFRLLEVLMNRPGRVFSRDELCAHAYADARHVSGRTLDSHVRRIRSKLRAAFVADDVDPIETVHGVGYR
ncbi:MAG: response regulator transcription factor, partial [Myxococcales bacterium]|nr:response regulator transcription factor [Myxococcales bacterium]